MNYGSLSDGEIALLICTGVILALGIYEVVSVLLGR